MPIGNRSGRTTESLTDITKSVPRIPAPKTYLERWGIIQMSVLIGVICLVCFTMIAMWWSTRPTYADARRSLPRAAAPRRNPSRRSRSSSWSTACSRAAPSNIAA